MNGMRVAFVCADGMSNGTTLDEPADDPDQYDPLNFTVVAETATVVDDQTAKIDSSF